MSNKKKLMVIHSYYNIGNLIATAIKKGYTAFLHNNLIYIRVGDEWETTKKPIDEFEVIEEKLMEAKKDYGRNKTVIMVRGKSGEPKHELTTWRNDIADKIAQATGCPIDLDNGDTVVITINANSKE